MVAFFVLFVSFFLLFIDFRREPCGLWRSWRRKQCDADDVLVEFFDDGVFEFVEFAFDVFEFFLDFRGDV